MATSKSVKRKKPNRMIRPNKQAKMEIGKKRHHFVSFPSEAAQLNINPVSSAITEVWADPDSPTTSIFHTRMQHWSDLNLTQGFMAFSQSVHQYSSLPLVIHNQAAIFELFKEHIALKDELTLESLYDVCTAFALDLQSEFGPYFDDFVALVAESSKLKNAAVIKACFDALTQIIKMLLRSSSSSSSLLLKTLNLFKLGIPPVTHRLCASALAQILRKSGPELRDCIIVLVKSAAQGLAELAGMIIVQSVKTTSKSVVANASKILQVSLEVIDNLDWSDDDVSALILAMLENLRGLEVNDILNIVTSILREWLNTATSTQAVKTNSHQMDESNFQPIKIINPKIRSLVQLLKLSRSSSKNSSSNEAEVLGRKFLTKCLEVEAVCEDALIEAFNVICSGQSREEAWLMIQDTVRSQTTKERRAKLLHSLSTLDHFECSLLHRVIQYLSNHEDKEESLFLATEGLWLFAQSKLKDTGADDVSYTIEFPCANPNDLNTLPNRLLVTLEKMDWDAEDDQVTKVLSMLAVVRPIHQEIAAKLFLQAVRNLAGNSQKVEPLGVAVRALGEISCPHEFLQILKESKVLPTLREQLANPLSAQALAYIFTVAASSNSVSWIDSAMKSEIAKQMIEHFHLASDVTRLSLVRCLVHLSENHAENFGAMLSAESIKPNIQTYREKLKFLTLLTCSAEMKDDFVIEANLRYLLSNLSVNFSLLWDPCIKIIESYWSMLDQEKSWNIFISIFCDINSRAAQEEARSNVEIDFQNFRNLFLKSLDLIVQVGEKKNAILTSEFLDVFMRGKPDTNDAKGLAAFLGVYKQFSNLRSVARFEEVRQLAERCLGDNYAKTREIAIDFFAAAFKELRQHKSVLMDLVDAKKWKSVFLTFPTEILESSEKFCELLCLIMVGKVRQTTKEKRKDQLNARKVIVRSIFQLGKQHGLEFLRLLHKQQVPFLNHSEEEASSRWSPQEIARKLDMVFDVYLLAANSAVTAVDGVIGGAKEIFSDLITLLKYQGRLIVEKNSLKKRRPKVLDQLIQMFKALQANEWTEEEEQGILNNCVWPLLQPEPTSGGDEPKEVQQPQQRTCYLAKIVALFNLWISLEKYTHWFFLKNSKTETVLDWVRTVFAGSTVDEDFRRKLFTCVCRFVLVNHESKKEKLTDEFIRALMAQFEAWIQQKGKSKGGGYADLPIRLNALSVIAGISRKDEINEKIFFDHVIAYAARGTGDVQTFAIAALNSLIVRRRGEPPPASAYKLLTSVVNNEDNKMAVRKMLWKHTENLGIPLNEKLLSAAAYKTILQSPDGVTNRQFLFLLHYGASEIYTSDYTTRSTAGACIRELIYVMKLQKSVEDYLHLVDTAVLPVLTRGLMSKTERVQAEFIEILLEAALEDGRLGNSVNISSLLNDTDDPELNFFDNMKHIQKHRRGRALNRLATRLDEDNAGVLNVKCCHVIVYPLACSYLFNNDYTKYSDTIQASISCIGSLCAKFGWKEYKMVLMYFLNCKPTEPAHQKQRVKVLAAILNSFHFVSVEGEDKKNEAANISATKIVNTLLHKMRLQRDDDEVDCALYVPILKILMLYPKKLKANISTLLAQTSRKLRSRFIEDRKLARDILCEMAALLGPNYFPYILSVLEGALQRGYQLHILVHTINVVMLAMEPFAFHGCYDSSIPKILEFVGKELFGSLTEEKKVAAIVKKTPEASKVVGFSLLESLASRMSKSLVCDVITGLLNQAATAKSTFDALQKLRRAIKSVQTGLARNKDLERPTDYFQLSYGILSGQLLPPEMVKAHSATLKEFALSLLMAGTSDAPVTGPQVRPFWPFFRDALENKDVNVVVACLKFLSIVTQNKDVCDVLIESDDRDFVGVISSKCKQYHAMKNRQPYMCVALVLRNLLTNGGNFEAGHLKAICLFFEGCLDTNRDDTNAMRLLGLVLFRFYSTDAYAPFLKLLCTSCIQCRSESTYNVAKSILIKIVKKHSSSYNPVINFFIANINYEEETGRRRSIAMCNLLLESCQDRGQNFETQGLFIEGATRLFNEYSQECKKLLETLLATIIKIQHKKKSQDGNAKNLVHELIVKWCRSPKAMHIGIGAKLMSLSLLAISGADNPKATRKSLSEILPKLGDILLGQGDDGTTVYSFALAHVVELLNTIVSSTSFKTEIFSVSTINAEKVSGLVLHQNTVVRRSVVKLFVSLLKIGFEETSERHDTSFADTTLGTWMSGDVMRTLVSNLCELAKSDPSELLSSCLASIFELSERGRIPELTEKFVYKKARSIFTHEKFNINHEWTRRKLYYEWAKEVCEKSESAVMKELIKKHLAKDMKQDQLADIVNEVQKVIEESHRKRK